MNIVIFVGALDDKRSLKFCFSFLHTPRISLSFRRIFVSWYFISCSPGVAMNLIFPTSTPETYSWLWFTRDRSTNRLEICPRLRPCTGPCSVRWNLGGADVMHSCVLESILTRENPVLGVEVVVIWR